MKMQKWLRLRFGFLWLCGIAFSASAQVLEQHAYQVVYRGVFSLGADWQIADLNLRTRLMPSEATYRESELSVSSSAYPSIESLYPMRYRFRSWYPADHSGSWVFEYREQTNHKDPKHKLIYFDHEDEPFVAYDAVKKGVPGDLRELELGRYTARYAKAVFDRLGMLQHIRAQPLMVGDQRQLSVSNGKQMLRYQVKVERRAKLSVGGEERDAIKVLFSGVKLDERGAERPSHRPIEMWFSDDAAHVPLLIVSRHPIGRFTIRLQPHAQASSSLAFAEEAVGGVSSSAR